MTPLMQKKKKNLLTLPPHHSPSIEALPQQKPIRAPHVMKQKKKHNNNLLSAICLRPNQVEKPGLPNKVGSTTYPKASVPQGKRTPKQAYPKAQLTQDPKSPGKRVGVLYIYSPKVPRMPYVVLKCNYCLAQNVALS